MKKHLNNLNSYISSRYVSDGRQCVKSFESIPGPKPLPLVGNIWRYLPLVGDYKFDQLYENARYNRKRYGPIVREQITRKHCILHLFDPNDIEKFFRHDGKEPHRRSHRALLKYRRERPEQYNDGGLFPENGPNWWRLRKLFQNHLMDKSKVSKRARILDDIALDSIENLRHNQQADSFEEFLYQWSIKSSLALFLDFHKENMPSEQSLNALIESLHHELEAIDGTEIKSESWSKKPHKCPFFQKLCRAEGVMHAFVEDRVNHLMSSESTTRNQPSYIRSWLVDHQLDRKDVITFVLDCILAGLHTTAYTTTFLLEHISSLNQEDRGELFREVSNRMPTISQRLETDPSDDMPLLKDCLKETLRLRPVSIGTGRLTQAPMVIRDYQIPEHVMVIAHNQTVCMDPNIYDQPERYQPKRWAKYRNLTRGERPSAFAWLPYGFGPRVCIGQRLITLQIHILTARLVQQFEWKFLDEIKTKAMLVHTLNGSVRVKLNRLEQERVS